MSFEDRKFTRQEVVHALRLCADGGSCEQCEFFEAECPKGYNPCYEELMMRKAADFIEERTAKVENIKVEWGDDEYVHDRMGDMYHYGDCGNCGQTVSHNQKYCHECGARLEWDE